METLITSSPEKEIAKKEIDMFKFVTLGSKEGKESSSVNLNLVESGLEDEKNSSDTPSLKVSVSNSLDKVATESKSQSDVVEHESIVGCGDDIKIVSGDENMKPSSMVLNNSLDDSETISDNDAKEKTEAESMMVFLQEECKKEDDSETISDNNAKEKTEAESMMVFLQEECKKEATDASNAIDASDKGVLEIKKCKRGRKKKVLGGSECNRDETPKKVKVDKIGVEVTGRLLRSRTMALSVSAKVDENKLNESVVGFKRQMEAECFDQTEFLKEVNESCHLVCRPKKKQKRRGRPPKMEGEAGFSNLQDECFDQIEIQKEINERSQVVGRPQKKQKRRGRPSKIQSEAGFRKIKDECSVSKENKQTHHGRLPKMQRETGLNLKMKDDAFDQVDLQKEVDESIQLTGRQQKKTQMKNHKDTVINNLKGCDRPPKMQAGNLSTKTEQLNNNPLKAKDAKKGSKITVDNKQKVKNSNDSNDHTTGEETVKGDNTKQLNYINGGEDRRKKQQYVREQIVSMIMKASWTIEYRPRQGRDYLDAVYVDQKGRTHWSITKAYFSLKKRIEDGDADTKEISAFTPIPVEEINVLFRSVSKIRSDKNKKKNKRGKSICKAEVVISGETSFKRTPNKKGRDGKKRKGTHSSAGKLANKLSSIKVKKDKNRKTHSVIADSAVQRRPKESKKGRQNRKPCLVARSSSKGFDQDSDDCAMYNRNRNIFSWMIDSGVIMPGSKLMYGEGRRRNKFLEGQVTCDGIHCSCCNEIMDISNFVSHGGGKLDQALKTIHCQSGEPLLMCLLKSWRKEVELTNINFNFVDVKGDDPNDDTCNICGDGGDLICCDGCPSTFHQNCIDIQNFPSGEWHCIYCCCKFCGLVACGASHDAPNPEMITCCLCEEKFHHSCLQEDDVINVGSSTLSFCGRKCQELYEQLQMHIGVKYELKEGYSWTLLKCYDLSQYLDDSMKVECNSKLAVAFSVMDECFVPIMDERSGINRIHNVVYNCGSNFRRLDYSGFFTAILEKGNELISAASIRIHGNRLAEMPFIGTRYMYRRQGMCRRLLDAIAGALCSFGVDELVIPAIPELFETWTKVFGFKPLEESLRQVMKGMSLIVFPGTDMLHKPLLKNQFADKDLSAVAVAGDKAMECINVKNDNNTHVQPSEDEHKSVGLDRLVNIDVPGVTMSPLSSKTVPKNSFDLNLQPAATDIDFQSIDEESVSRDPKVCKCSSEPSDSMAQVDNAATQPLVLV